MLLHLVALLLLFAGPGSSSADLELPRPERSWRATPAAVESEPESPELRRDLAEGRDGTLIGRERLLRVELDLEADPHELMLTFTRNPRNGWMLEPRTEYLAEISGYHGGKLLGWREHARGREQEGRLDKIMLPPSAAKRRLRLTVRSKREPPRLADIGLYRLRKGAAQDYWLCLGASIQEQAVRHAAFKALVEERFGYDPVLFNRAVGGWASRDLRRELAAILADHPHARFVLVHIGGNDVSAQRPYPGGAETLRANLRAIISAVTAAGKVPMVARLSYRRYRSSPRVGPEANGSLPYVLEVYDPLIRELTPWLYDAAAARGRVDAYGWFRTHPDTLKPDGIHPNTAGRAAWNRLWVDAVGPLVYRRTAGRR